MKTNRFKSVVLFSNIILVLLFGCKKEIATPDDPTIIYRNINKTFTTSIGGNFGDSLDLNYDGIYDVYMKIENTGDSGTVTFFEQHINSFQAVKDGSMYDESVKVFVLGELTPLFMSLNYSFMEGHLYISLKSNGLRKGIVNGDGYIVFRFSTGTEYQYGWMKVSINSAFTEFKVIEYAYSIDPDTPIKVGAK